MSVTTIKFCGLTRPEDAAFASEVGASHAGVIFAASARQVTPRRAAEILDATVPGTKRVGVTDAITLGRIAAIIRDVQLDVIQMHGAPCLDLIPAVREIFGGEIWTVVGVGRPELAVKAISQAARISDGVLLDTAVAGRTGGTGRPFDWTAMARAVSETVALPPLILAGGLTAANVAGAIKLLRPRIVDVSSGVESAAGIKDHNLMRAFAEAVHSASMV